MNTRSLARHLPPSPALVAERLLQQLPLAWRRYRAARRARGEAHAAAELLSTLDRRTLRDLGFEPCESSTAQDIGRCVAEFDRIRVA